MVKWNQNEWFILCNEINKEINKRGYNFTTYCVIDEYHKIKKGGEFKNYAIKEIIEMFKLELDKFYKIYK